MALKLGNIIKFLLLASVILGGVFLRKNSGKRMLCFSIFAIISAIVANALAGMISPMHDEITLTALGDKSEEASLDEIWFTGYAVEGEFFSNGHSLQICEGKWFWSGEAYTWRNESDPRRPDGMTRSIRIALPVGYNRELVFSTYPYSGRVEVTDAEGAKIIDLYSEIPGELRVPISSSETSVIVLNQTIRILAYSVVIFGILVIEFVLQRIAAVKPGWIGTNAGKIAYAMLAVTVFVFLEKNADSMSLWADELLQLDGARQGVAAAVSQNLQMLDATPPLYSTVAALWYGVAPYGERWLFLINTVPVALAVYILGEKLAGKTGGWLAAVLVGFSSTVWINVAFEFRAYSFLLLFTTLSIYCYFQRNQTTRQGEKILFSVALVFLTFSHYFGMLLCGIYFLIDLLLIFRRKLSPKIIWLYVCPGLLSLLWLGAVYVVTLRHTTPAAIAAWYPLPTLKGIKDIVYALSGGTGLAEGLAWFGMIFVLVSGKKDLEESDFQWRSAHRFFAASVIIAVFGIMYVYGNYINTASTMFQMRYFVILIPFISLLFPVACTETIGFIENSAPNSKGILKKAIAVYISVILVWNCISVPLISVQPYREQADWLYTQSNDIFDPTTAVVMTSGLEEPWREYYVSREGRRDALDILITDPVDFISRSEDGGGYNKVYVLYSHIPMDASFSTYLAQNYMLQEDIPQLQLSVYTRII